MLLWFLFISIDFELSSWSVLLKKVEDILGEHAILFKEHYYIKPTGNCDLSRMSDPHNEFKGKNVLIELNDSSASASKLGMLLEKYLNILGECRRKLFDVRSKRPRPHLDDKVFSFFLLSFRLHPCLLKKQRLKFIY